MARSIRSSKVIWLQKLFLRQTTSWLLDACKLSCIACRQSVQAISPRLDVAFVLPVGEARHCSALHAIS